MSLEFEAIGPYRVTGLLGQGGMGTVYSGVHAKNEQRVAIKVLSSSLAQHARFRRRFDAEIQTLLRLKHPNIVQLIGFGEEKGLLFYSMELVDGENLHQILKRESTLPWTQMMDWAIEICDALKHAHNFGIIHRDLKPANLMINTAGSIKLTDFGIVKLYGASEATVVGSILGTADFMSPEQAEGKSVSVRSDLYSLGAICYACLAGRAPFTGQSVPEIMFNVRYGNLTPLSQLAPKAPDEFCELVMELLNRDASRRPPTALAVGNRLKSMKAGLSKSFAIAPRNTTDVEHAKEMTSIDMSDYPSIARLSDAPENRATRFGTPEHSNLPNSLEPSKNRSYSEATKYGNRSVAGPDDVTQAVASSDSANSAHQDIPSGIEAMGKTHFTEVTDQDRRRSTVSLATPHEEPSGTPWTSVAAIGSMLACCLGLAYWLSRPPSATSLFQKIQSTALADDEDALLDAEPTVQRFLELYPEDTRASEVKETLDEINILKTLRRLQVRSGYRADKFATQSIDPLEQSTIDCLRLSSVDPKATLKKLDALLVVFASTEQLSPYQKKLIEANRRLRDQLQKNGLSTTPNHAADQLSQQMRWAETTLNPQERKLFLQGIVELYSDKPWAKEIMESVKRQLENSDK